MRDCENCEHYVLKDTRDYKGDVVRARGCEMWDCEFEPREEVEDGNEDKRNDH